VPPAEEQDLVAIVESTKEATVVPSRSGSTNP
jgi:hypothetical protein